MIRGRRTWVAALAVAAALSEAACYRAYAVEGHLVASDARDGVQCEVTVAEPTHAEGAGHECSSPTVPPLDIDGPWIVLTGSRFRCVVSYDGGTQHLRVRCPGYPPADHPFPGCDSGCDDVDLGVILVER